MTVFFPDCGNNKKLYIQTTLYTKLQKHFVFRKKRISKSFDIVVIRSKREVQLTRVPGTHGFVFFCSFEDEHVF